MVSLLLRFPYIFYASFVVINLLPINRGGGGRKIPVRKVWRLLLYSGGFVMGVSYALCGIILAITQPFSACMEPEKDYLMWYVYTTLLPVGLIMGAFHVGFLKMRYGPKEGEGVAISDGGTVLCCFLGQSVWLAIWGAWIAAVVSSCGFMVSPLALSLSCFGSLIIVSVNILRLVLFARYGFRCKEFAEAYTGADFSESDASYAKMGNT